MTPLSRETARQDQPEPSGLRPISREAHRPAAPSASPPVGAARPWASPYCWMKAPCAAAELAWLVAGRTLDGASRVSLAERGAFLKEGVARRG